MISWTFKANMRFAYLWLSCRVGYVIWLKSSYQNWSNPCTMLDAHVLDEHRLLYTSSMDVFVCAQCFRPVEMAHVYAIYRRCSAAYLSYDHACMNVCSIQCCFQLMCLHRVRVRYTNYKRFYFANRTHSATEHIRDLFFHQKRCIHFADKEKWIGATFYWKIYGAHCDFTNCEFTLRHIPIDCAKTLNSTQFYK